MRNVYMNVGRCVAVGCLVAGAAVGGALGQQTLLQLDAPLLLNREGGGTLVQGLNPPANALMTELMGGTRMGTPFGLSLGATDAGGTSDVRLADGMVVARTGGLSIEQVDLALPCRGVPWEIGRSFSGQQVMPMGSSTPGDPMDSEGYQGWNWAQDSQPELVVAEGSDDCGDSITIVWGARTIATFRRVCDETTGTSVYRGVNGLGGAIVATVDANGPDTYTLHDLTGRRAVFFGHDSQSGVAKGQLWKVEDAAGHRVFAGHATSAGTAISNGFDGAGRIVKAHDPAGREYTYSYSGTPARLTGVTVTAGVTGTIAVGYSYYGSGAADGLPGDLQSVTVTVPMTSGSALVRKRHFRYYTGAFSSQNPGHPHQLRMLVEAGRVYGNLRARNQRLKRQRGRRLRLMPRLK